MSRIFSLGFLLFFTSVAFARSPLVVVKAVKEETPTTDQAILINQALTTVSESGGGIVQLRGGTFHISSSIVIPSNVLLRGKGNGTKIRLMDGSTGVTELVRFGSGDDLVARAGLEDILINGNFENQTQAIDGVLVKGEFITLRRVHVRNSNGDGLVIGSASTVDTTSTVAVLDSVSQDNQGDGVTVANAQRVQLVALVSRRNTGDGVELSGVADNTIVANGRINNNGANGIVLGTGVLYASVTDNKMANNALAGLLLTGSDFGRIDNNYFIRNGNNGMLVQGSVNNRFGGNKLFNNSKSQRHGYYEVRIEAAGDNQSFANVFIGNEFFSKRGKGLLLEADGTDNSQITRNIYQATHPLFDLVGSNSFTADNFEGVELN